MDVANELLDAIEIIVDKKVRENTAQIYPGICKSVSGGNCVMSINGKDNTIQFYGSIPTVGAIYRVFVPDGNMSMAFAITGNDDRKGLHYSNPNLLDNWYLANPIDQQGGYVVPPGVASYLDKELTKLAGDTTGYRRVIETTSTYIAYTGIDGVTYYCVPGTAVRGYTGTVRGIDRWRTESTGSNDAVVEIVDGGIKFTNRGSGDALFIQGIKQILNAGATYTFSAFVTEKTGNVFLSTYNTPVSVGVTSASYTASEQSYGIVYIWIRGAGSVTIKAVKLELGDHQTLAHQDENGVWQLNEIPDYEEQLRRCQYYSRFFGESIEIPCSNNQAGTYIEGTLPLTMRSGNGAISYSKGFLFVGNGTFYTVTSAIVSSNGGRVKIGVNVNGQLDSNLQATLYLRDCSILFDL